MLVGSGILAANIESLVNVAPELVSDLRVTVVVAFLNAAVGLVAVVFGVAAFIRNDLFLNSIGQLTGSVLRVALLFVLFGPPPRTCGISALPDLRQRLLLPQFRSP